MTPRRPMLPLNAARALALLLATNAPVIAQTAPDPATDMPPMSDATVRVEVLPPPSRGLAGAYLAARQASNEADFAAASRYYARALQQDPGNTLLADNVLYATIGNGDMQQALTQARELTARGISTDMTRLVLRADRAREGDWAGLIALLDADPPGDVSGARLMGGMMRAWAQLGEGKASDAVATFESLFTVLGARGMVNYNLGLAKAMVGDYEGALALIDRDGAGQHLPGLMAKAEILTQLDRREEALAALESIPGELDEPALDDLRQRIESGEDVAFTAIRAPRDGIAQVFLTFATVLGVGPNPDPLALTHARLAVWVQPDLAEARLMLAQLLLQAGQLDMAAEQYEALSKSGPVRPFVELTRIDALARGDRQEEAIAAAEALTQSHPKLAESWIALGDLRRQTSRFPEAVTAYDKALELIPADNGEGRWFPLYARGIALERSGDFTRAEADFRAALAIRPDHPQILNYLGYSFIDRGENLDEALEMIGKAVEIQPDGYILDSLGWGYYRLGRYAEAVEPMEQAVAVMADDPLVNDHLGDVYWMVGRKREAEIQWSRALSLIREDTPSSSEVDPVRIRAKLDRGLDAVLEDEAAGRPLAPPEEGAESSN